MTYVEPPTYDQLVAAINTAADALRQIHAAAVEQGGGDLSLAEPGWRWAGELAAETLDAMGLEP